MANKETKEFAVAVAETFKSFRQMLEDGEFNGLSEIAFVVDDIDDWERAIKDIDKAPAEWPSMSNEEKDDIFNSVSNIIGEMDEDDKSDFIDFGKGIFSAIRYVSRKRNSEEQIPA